MRASSGSGFPGRTVAKKPTSKDATKKRASVAEEVDDDTEPTFIPKNLRLNVMSKKTQASLDRLASVAKKIEKRTYDEEPEDDEEFAVLPKRSQALVVSKILGVENFEIERAVRPEAPEETVEETSEDGNTDFKAVKKNNRHVSAPSRLPGESSRDRVRGSTTLFGQRADTILSLLENEERTDGALTLIQRTLLQTLVDVLPVIERGVRRSNGRHGVIPLNQTISQVRELVQDLQSLRDRGHLGATIVERVLRPAFLDIGVQIALAFNGMILSSKAKMTPDDFAVFSQELQDTQRGIATYMQQQYKEVKDGVTSSLS